MGLPDNMNTLTTDTNILTSAKRFINKDQSMN